MNQPSVVLCRLEGALLRSNCTFPYYFLVAFEAGSIFRALFLLLMYPIILLVQHLVSESLALEVTIFITIAGLKVSVLELVSRAVLPKFFLEDMRRDAYDALLGNSRRYIVTSIPRIMVESFAKDFLFAERVLGTELQTFRSRTYCTGLVLSSRSRQKSVSRAKFLFYNSQEPQLGIGRDNSDQDRGFLDICKDRLVIQSCPAAKPVARKYYLRPLIFHDGRIAVRPTPAMALAIFLWLPFGTFLLLLRIGCLVFIPNIGHILLCEALLGVKLRCKGSPPKMNEQKHGSMFICCHRTLLDPVILSGMIFRRVTAVTYRISRLSEILSPIRTVRLTRCRSTDAGNMRKHLQNGDLIVCPEGTTCREPYLLRFSKLFVELATDGRAVFPVAMQCRVQLFHGTSARGWKAMDPIFFGLNPWPSYEVTFLDKVVLQNVEDGDAEQAANMIQHRIAKALDYECTTFTRRDKYRALAEEP